MGGALNGGTGTNTLTGDNTANTWTITAADAGTVTGITGGFTNIANLTGGTGTDSFTLSGGSLSGCDRRRSYRREHADRRQRCQHLDDQCGGRR